MILSSKCGILFEIVVSPTGLSSAQLSAIKKEYQASSFPGLEIPMNQVITMTVKTKKIIKIHVTKMSFHDEYNAR